MPGVSIAQAQVGVLKCMGVKTPPGQVAKRLGERVEDQHIRRFDVQGLDHLVQQDAHAEIEVHTAGNCHINCAQGG